MRLQKYLAEAGVASRRKSEEYITSGRVSVNGETVRELGSKVEEGDEVAFDGKVVSPQKKLCILFYKPSGVMCTSNDPMGRPVVGDYFKELGVRLYTVGRLDYDTEGLLVVTNDGELANVLAHPSHSIEKTYFVVCRNKMEHDAISKLREGVEIDGKPTAPAKVKVVSSNEHSTRMYITICEGRNRQIRKMCYAVGHDVTFLRRESEGGLTLEGLKPGEWRFLSDKETSALLKEAGASAKSCM